jgi:TolA-binding protein
MSKVSSAKTRGRLTKKELKQDKLVEFTVMAEKFYAERKNLVLGLAAAIVVVIVGIIVLRNTFQSARLEKSYDLTLAKMQYGAGKLDEAKPGFEKVMREGGSAAAEAKYFLGRIAFEKGNFTQAAEEFKDFLKNYSSDEELDCAASSGLAATYEAQGNDAEAAKAFEDIGMKYPRNSYATQALYQASRLYIKLNEKDKAIHVLETIRDKYPESSIVAQVRRDLENF